MIATSFDEANLVLEKPPSMTHEQCECLSVLKTVAEDGVPVLISLWKLTKAELEQVNRTGRVWLTVAGEIMPPVALDVERPFRVEEP